MVPIFSSFTRFAVKFVITMIVMTIVSTLAWDAFVNGKVYGNPDGGSLDYWFVGDWVHHPVTVQRIIGGRPMGEPDTIKEGWSVFGLWCLWFSFLGTSIIVSVLAASARWIPQFERTGDLVA
jgi:hypothetical protein